MITVVSDPSALAATVAEHIVVRANEAIAVRRRFMIALAGGSTSRATYELVASDALASRIDWRRVHVVFGDERCVGPDDQLSNFRMAREALLDWVPVPSSHVHRIRGEDDPAQAAALYERQLRQLLGSNMPDAALDLVLLGLGEDGHTASLFPGQCAVRERVRWVVAESIGALSSWRITLTPVVLNAARAVSFVVSGPSKANAVREVLEGRKAPDRLPAQVIDPRGGQLSWFMDAAAASHLRQHNLRAVGP